MVYVFRDVFLIVAVLAYSGGVADADGASLYPMTNSELAIHTAEVPEPIGVVEIASSRFFLQTNELPQILLVGIENHISDAGLASVSQASISLAMRAVLH
jgi:hypothetical protein